jgi:hypothetical protein
MTVPVRLSCSNAGFVGYTVTENFFGRHIVFDGTMMRQPPTAAGIPVVGYSEVCFERPRQPGTEEGPIGSRL